MASEVTFQVVSFGCKVNQVEGETLAANLRGVGLREVARAGLASLVIVNTCAVTGEAARQCRQRIRRALRGGARVIVTGCAAHPAAEDAALQSIPGLLLVTPGKQHVADFLRQCGRRTCRPGRSPGAWAGPADPDAGASPQPTCPPSAPERSRALVKIQDGCPAACAYCIVPKVRPTARSAPPEAVLGQVRELIAAGFREFVLCGIHLGLYGADLAPRATPPPGVARPRAVAWPCMPGVPHGHLTAGDRATPPVTEEAHPRTDLADLLERLLTVPGLGRVRLSSLEPTEVSDRLLALLAAEPERLCPHLHIPLQSGDDGVLERMGRPYTSADFLAVVERIRRALAQPTVTTDVLVGFPGETEAAFAETLRVCREAAFSRLHVFPFSKRPGTRAAAMKPEVPRTTLHERCRRAAELRHTLAEAYRASLVGRTAQVVIEKLLPDGGAEGLSERHVRVRLRGPLPPGAERRMIVPVRLRRLEGEFIEAEAESNAV
jgi:threonylcarbamoyladenosine tRNA methylthiotransferase MtaB